MVCTGSYSNICTDGNLYVALGAAVAGGLTGVTSVDIQGEAVGEKIFGGTDDVFGNGDVQTGTSTTIKDPRPTGTGGGTSAPPKTPTTTGTTDVTGSQVSALQKVQTSRNIAPNPKIKGDKGTTFGTITRTDSKKGFDGYYTDFDGVEDKNYGSRTEFDGVE